MYNQHLNLNFLNQFRWGFQPVSLCEEQKIGNTIYCPYSQEMREAEILGKLLCERLGHVKIVRKLQEKLKDDGAATVQLNATIKRLKRQLSDYGRAEPYTASYYQKAIHLLTQLSHLVETFSGIALQRLLDGLMLIGSGNTNEEVEPIISSDIEEVQVIFLKYIKELANYCAELKSLQEQEAGSGKRDTLTTQVEQCLLLAMAEISKSINVHDSTDQLLNKWRIALEFTEKAECYN